MFRFRLSLVAMLALLIPVLASEGSRSESECGDSKESPLLSPVGGERWAAGSRHLLRWNPASFPSGATVRIASSTDDGKTWSEQAPAAPNTGRYVWKVPDAPGGRGRVRLSAGSITIGNSRAFPILPSQERTDYRWERVTLNAPFAPRDGAGALSYRGKMWFLGGWNPNDKRHFPRICNNEVWSSADGAQWELVKPNTFLDRSFDAASDWEGRHTAGYVVHENRMWIVGGDVNQGHYHFDVWNSEDGKSWNLVNRGRPVPWGPRALHYTAAYRGRIWVLGGQTVPQMAASPEAIHRDVWTSKDGVDWEKIEPQEPCWSPRGMIGGSAVHRGRLWVLGGGTYDTPKYPARNYYSDVWSTRDGVRWTRHTEAAPWEPRQYHDVAAWDDRLWVMEGYARANRNDVWYSSDGVNWYELPNTPWKPRHAASVFVHNGSLWMVAGNNMEPDVWKLVPAVKKTP